MRINKEYKEDDNQPVLVKPDFRVTRGHTRIAQVFWNADMRNRHTGLAQIAKDHGIEVEKLQPGQYVVFINSHKTQLTIYTANNIIASYRSPHGRIDERTIAIIPETFQAQGKVDYDEALKDVLVKELTKKTRQKIVEALAVPKIEQRLPRRIYVRPEREATRASA